MKTLLYGILILVLVGIAGFAYRSVEESSGSAPIAGTACTLEAKICPDGTTVARSGPGCTFAACPADNVEVPTSGIAFALPAGYVADENAASADPSMVGAFVKIEDGTSTPAGTIIIHDFKIPSGSSASSVMLAHAIKQPSGQAATSNQFTPKVIGSATYQSIVLQRFEGDVESAYFLPRSHDVLEFDIEENGVANWNDPSLKVDALPEHQSLLKLLSGLQDNDPATVQQSAPTATTTGA